MINYFAPDILSLITTVSFELQNVTEINFDSFDAKFFVSALIIVFYGIYWPKRQTANRKV